MTRLLRRAALFAFALLHIPEALTHMPRRSPCRGRRVPPPAIGSGPCGGSRPPGVGSGGFPEGKLPGILVLDHEDPARDVTVFAVRTSEALQPVR